MVMLKRKRMNFLNEQTRERVNCLHSYNPLIQYYLARVIKRILPLQRRYLISIVSFSTLNLTLTSQVITEKPATITNHPATLVLVHTRVSLEKTKTQHPLGLFG